MPTPAQMINLPPPLSMEIVDTARVLFEPTAFDILSRASRPRPVEVVRTTQPDPPTVAFPTLAALGFVFPDGVAVQSGLIDTCSNCEHCNRPQEKTKNRT